VNKSLQLPLDLPHRPALSGEDFFVAPANQEAIGRVDGWPDWPAPGVVIHGEPGCGKSHLAQVFAARTGAPVIPANRLAGDVDAMTADAPVAIIDDADLAIEDDDAAQEALFHLYNVQQQRGRKLLLTAKTPSSRWRVALADLRSRLSTLEQIAIRLPDDALLGVMLVKLFADRQLTVEPDVVGYLVSRMGRSAAAAVSLVEALDHEALARKRRITVPLARDVLDRRHATDRRTTEQ